MTPIVFVFGELLPKYLFYHAPYRLITATRPFLLAATVLFAPVSLMLGLLGRGFAADHWANPVPATAGDGPWRVGSGAPTGS